MIQVIRAAPRKPSTKEQIGRSLGQALVGGLQIYGEHRKQQQQKQQFAEAMQRVKDVHSNRSLSDQQRLILTHEALSGFPDHQKSLGEQLSKSYETPIQAAQRKKIEYETDQAKEEDNYYNRLMNGENQEDEYSNSRQGDEEDLGNQSWQDFEEPEVEVPRKTTPKQQPKVKFDPKDTNTWTDKQIDEFKSYEGKNSKAKTFAKKAQGEFDRREDKKNKTTAYKETVAPYESALKTINEMRKIGSRGKLGVGTSWSPLAKTQKDAAEYERLGKSLIALASTITIRNQREFDVLSEDLYDPTLTDAKREGILSAMEKIIKESIEGVENPENGPKPDSTARAGTAPKQRRPLTSFVR